MKILNDWALTRVLAFFLVATCAWLVFRHGGNVDDIRLVIRVTARTSLVLFLLTFTASSLAKLAPSAATAWQLRNRRYLGVSFAVSHVIHLAGIVGLALTDRVLFGHLVKPATLIFASPAYLLIFAMALTSSDGAVTWLGLRRWRRLHFFGIWYIWIIFAAGIAKRMMLGPLYWLFAILVLAAAITRLSARSARRKKPACPQFVQETIPNEIPNHHQE